MSLRYTPLAELAVPGRRLGRHIVHDQRSHNFAAARADAVQSVNHAAIGLPLDQGQIGSCTANALCGALACVPNAPAAGIQTEADAVALYARETANEGQPYPPNDPGGSGLMVCQAARELGLITGYQHAFGIDHALEALVLRPVITGINWYDSFEEPDVSGLVEIAPGAKVRGGHEIVANQINAERQVVWFWNSWGPGYGVGGRFCMSFATWERLLSEQGDVTVPIR